MPKREIKGNHERSFKFKRKHVDEDARTVELAFSSEEPYERWYGIEILDHKKESVRLGRLENGGALLMDHNTRDQVGVVEQVKIDDDLKGRATVRFGSGQRASEIFEDVKDGIRQLVSVGYAVHKYEVEKKGKDGESDVYRMTDWEPHEISIVAVPADTSVGVGRSNEIIESKEEIEMPKEVKEQAATPEVEAVDVGAIQKEARKAEQERIRGISSVADMHDLGEQAREYIEEGRSVADFQSLALKEIGKKNTEVRANQGKDHDETIGLSAKEARDFSVVRAMAAIANPQSREAQEAAAFEIEVSSASADKAGITPRGLYIPLEVRDLSAGTPTDGAELVADNLLAGSYIESLRNSLAVAGAGATYLNGLVGNVDIPRQTSAAAGTWISAEDGDATESEPQFDQVSLTPKDLGCYTEVTRRLMMQSTPAIEAIVRNDLIQAAATSIDLAALYGSGASGQPKGVANQTGINTFNFAAAAPTYAETVRMVKEVMADNALMGALGYIVDPSGWEDAKTTEKASGTAQFIMSADGTINGYSTTVSNQVTAEDWFFGNWADLLIGQWGGLELNVDPYTHSLKGKTRFVMFQTVDTSVRHPVSFIHCNDGA